LLIFLSAPISHPLNPASAAATAAIPAVIAASALVRPARPISGNSRFVLEVASPTFVSLLSNNLITY
jgi:hypothetical protein